MTPDPKENPKFSMENQPDGREEMIRKTRNELFALYFLAENTERFVGPQLQTFADAIAEDLAEIFPDSEIIVGDPHGAMQKVRDDVMELQKKYPNDSEVWDLVKLYAEFEQYIVDGDKANIENWRSVQEITESIGKEVGPFKEKRLSPEAALASLPSQHSLRTTLDIAAEEAIEVDYVIADKRLNAPVIVLAPQQHPPVSMKLYEELRKVFLRYNAGDNPILRPITEAHEKITGAFKVLAGEKMYYEGFVQGVPIKESPYGTVLAAWNVINQSAFAEGLETPLIYRQSPDESDLRTTFENVYIADGILDDVVKSGAVHAGVVIGLAHESDETVSVPGMGAAKINNIPLSSLLAAGGLNVVVLKPAPLEMMDVAKLAELDGLARIIAMLDVMRADAGMHEKLFAFLKKRSLQEVDEESKKIRDEALSTLRLVVKNEQLAKELLDTAITWNRRSAQEMVPRILKSLD